VAADLHVVAIGGGSGLAVALRGLKARVGEEIGSLQAVVTVTDDGGSSGRLRRDFGVLPPGDIRNCLVALADDEDLLARLFQYRFTNGEGLSGHSFGNLLLTALTGITGDFYQAVLTAETILSVKGRILPATLADVRLSARGLSGRHYDGESAVGLSAEPLDLLRLEPSAPAAFRPAVDAILAADVVVLGPGSLYTSILPNLLIPGIGRAVRETEARVVLPLNLMTQPGESDGLGAADHLRALEQHTEPGLVDVVLVHRGLLPAERLAAYRELGAAPVWREGERLDGARVEERDLLAPGELIRHDPARLAEAVLDIARKESP
jgi:uncharacterized cofD-like protein